jgi:hypothetical protein
MKNIYASKQVGDISYMVSDIDTLMSIIDKEQIWTSKSTERNTDLGKLMHFVSFSRDLTSAARRKASRWKYGIIVDGTKLSNRYKIVPFSFVGHALETKNRLSVKYIVKYDDGTYHLSVVNWNTSQIKESLYEQIKEAIEAMPEEDKIKKRLEVSTGKRNIGNRRIVEKYLFNVPKGGLGLNRDLLPSNPSEISTNPAFYESEERVWTDNQYIDISGCIKGVILPKAEADILENDPEQDEDILELYELIMEVIGDDCKVIGY